MFSLLNAVHLMHNDIRTVLVHACHSKCSLKLHFLDFGSFFKNKDMYNTSSISGAPCSRCMANGADISVLLVPLDLTGKYKMISKLMKPKMEFCSCLCMWFYGYHLHTCVLEKLKFNEYTDVKFGRILMLNKRLLISVCPSRTSCFSREHQHMVNEFYILSFSRDIRSSCVVSKCLKHCIENFLLLISERQNGYLCICPELTGTRRKKHRRPNQRRSNST